jgi:hypothetical protein
MAVCDLNRCDDFGRHRRADAGAVDGGAGYWKVLGSAREELKKVGRPSCVPWELGLRFRFLLKGVPIDFPILETPWAGVWGGDVTAVTGRLPAVLAGYERRCRGWLSIAGGQSWAIKAAFAPFRGADPSSAGKCDGIAIAINKADGGAPHAFFFFCKSGKRMLHHSNRD